MNGDDIISGGSAAALRGAGDVYSYAGVCNHDNDNDNKHLFAVFFVCLFVMQGRLLLP
jgi:hypothetical protein